MPSYTLKKVQSINKVKINIDQTNIPKIDLNCDEGKTF
jgi:hypothetical protein